MITDAQLDVLVQTYDAWKPSMRSIHQNQVLDALSELQVARLHIEELRTVLLGAGIQLASSAGVILDQLRQKHEAASQKKTAPEGAAVSLAGSDG